MSIFREKPAFYYAAVGLLALYIVLTLVSLFSLPADASGVEQLVLSDSASLWGLLATVDGLRVFVWVVAVLVLVSQLAVDRHAKPQAIGQQST